MPEENKTARKRALLYAITFFFSLSAAVPTYFSSTFLAEVLRSFTFFAGSADKLVSIVYAASALLGMACFVEMPTALKRLGNFRTAALLFGIQIASLAGLVLFPKSLPMAVILSFLANFVSISLTNFCMDIFLESYSTDGKTGKIRGTFLTFGNIAWVAAPLIAPTVIGDGGIERIYVLSAILLLPVISIAFTGLRGFKDPVYERVPFWKSFIEVWRDRNIKDILMAQFLLQFFYCWMVVYTPLYLLHNVGFDEYSVGIILFVMLLPFLLLEAPLGRLADSRWGEKEMLALGFVILSVSTMLIAFLSDHDIVAWAALLFMTRVGAAMVEIMAETYFFKKVDASKTYLISFARMARPMAYVVAPIVAILLFTVLDMRGLFIFLGFFMLYGVRYALAIEDTN